MSGNKLPPTLGLQDYIQEMYSGMAYPGCSLTGKTINEMTATEILAKYTYFKAATDYSNPFSHKKQRLLSYENTENGRMYQGKESEPSGQDQGGTVFITHRKPPGLTLESHILGGRAQDQSCLSTPDLPRKRMEFRPSIEFWPSARPKKVAPDEKPQAMQETQIREEIIPARGHLNIYGQETAYYGPAPFSYAHQPPQPFDLEAHALQPSKSRESSCGQLPPLTPGSRKSRQILKSQQRGMDGVNSTFSPTKVYEVSYVTVIPVLSPLSHPHNPLSSHASLVKIENTGHKGHRKLHRSKRSVSRGPILFDIPGTDSAPSSPVILPSGHSEKSRPKRNAPHESSTTQSQQAEGLTGSVMEANTPCRTLFNPLAEFGLYYDLTEDEEEDKEQAGVDTKNEIEAELNRLQAMPYDQKMDRWMDFGEDEFCFV